MLENEVRLLALGWREVLCCWALGSAPVALADEECAADLASVDLSRLCIYEVALGLNDGTRLALVVDANDLVPNLEVKSIRADGNRSDYLNASLAVDGSLGIKGRCAGDIPRCGTCDEVEDVLVGLLEGQVDWESRERCELRMEFVKKVPLILLDPDCICL